LRAYELCGLASSSLKLVIFLSKGLNRLKPPTPSTYPRPSLTIFFPRWLAMRPITVFVHPLLFLFPPFFRRRVRAAPPSRNQVYRGPLSPVLLFDSLPAYPDFYHGYIVPLPHPPPSKIQLPFSSPFFPSYPPETNSLKWSPAVPSGIFPFCWR